MTSLLLDVRHGATAEKALCFQSTRTPLEQVFAGAVAQRRFNLLLLGTFAVAALLLAVVGIYGVVAFAVGRRRREIGVRVALGAQPRDVARLAVSWGVAPVVAGLAAGLAGTLAVSRLIEGLLFGVSPADPATLAGVALVMTAAAAIACAQPARAGDSSGSRRHAAGVRAIQ